MGKHVLCQKLSNTLIIWVSFSSRPSAELPGSEEMEWAFHWSQGARDLRMEWQEDGKGELEETEQKLPPRGQPKEP